jgi:hypothetical protein
MKHISWSFLKKKLPFFKWSVVGMWKIYGVKECGYLSGLLINSDRSSSHSQGQLYHTPLTSYQRYILFGNKILNATWIILTELAFLRQQNKIDFKSPIQETPKHMPEIVHNTKKHYFAYIVTIKYIILGIISFLPKVELDCTNFN